MGIDIKTTKTFSKVLKAHKYNNILLICNVIWCIGIYIVIFCNKILYLEIYMIDNPHNPNLYKNTTQFNSVQISIKAQNGYRF